MLLATTHGKSSDVSKIESDEQLTGMDRMNRITASDRSLNGFVVYPVYPVNPCKIMICIHVWFRPVRLGITVCCP
jgi:hypothetical protein